MGKVILKVILVVIAFFVVTGCAGPIKVLVPDEHGVANESEFVRVQKDFMTNISIQYMAAYYMKSLARAGKETKIVPTRVYLQPEHLSKIPKDASEIDLHMIIVNLGEDPYWLHLYSKSESFSYDFRVEDKVTSFERHLTISLPLDRTSTTAIKTTVVVGKGEDRSFAIGPFLYQLE